MFDNVGKNEQQIIRSFVNNAEEIHEAHEQVKEDKIMKQNLIVCLPPITGGMKLNTDGSA